MLNNNTTLTQFLLKSHQDGNASHGRLYCGLPGEESPPAPPDPTAATSYHNFKWGKKTILAIYPTMLI